MALLGQAEGQEFLLEDFLGKTPVLRVIEFFLIHDNKDYTITDICEGAGVSRTLVYEGLLEHLLDRNIIIQSRTIGNSRLFRLNMYEHKVEFLYQLREKLISQKTLDKPKHHRIGSRSNFKVTFPNTNTRVEHVMTRTLKDYGT